MEHVSIAVRVEYHMDGCFVEEEEKMIMEVPEEGWTEAWKHWKGRRVRVEWVEVEEGAGGKQEVRRRAEGIVTDDWVRPEDVKAAASPFVAEIKMVSETIPFRLDSGLVKQLPVKNLKKVWRLD